MAQREIRDGIPLAGRSRTLEKIGTVSKLKLVNKGDRAFLIAKINSELGNPRRSESAARIALGYEAGRNNFYEAARKAKALGLEEKAREFARQYVEYCITYDDFGEAVSAALRFSVKESAVRAAATVAERFILDGDLQSAEKLAAIFGIGDNLEAFAKTHVETLMGEGQYWAAACLAKRFSLKEKAREAAIKQIETEDSPPSQNCLGLARESGASEEEIFSAVEKSLGVVLAKGDSPHMFLHFLEDLGDSPLPKEKFREMAMVCIRKIAENGHYPQALITARKYGIPREDIRDIAIQAISSVMGTDGDETARISEDFGIGGEELAKIADEALINRIRKGNYPAAEMIAHTYPVSDCNLQFARGLLEALS